MTRVSARQAMEDSGLVPGEFYGTVYPRLHRRWDRGPRVVVAVPLAERANTDSQGRTERSFIGYRGDRRPDQYDRPILPIPKKGKAGTPQTPRPSV